ncbi:MAG: hydroxymethylbilane synthase [Candidatus Glassbacteria bacterium]|nr:hydroxymethylbilane synthase [Candidatus Glassbacteria bacterium]
MSADRLVIGSRGSRLALWQAGFVKDSLLRKYPGLEVEVRVIKTRGDKILDVALSKVGGKGLFTKELEQAILSGGVDLAVHSMKDLPTDLPEGLVAGVVTRRSHGSDVLVSRGDLAFRDLPPGVRVGTGSLRRRVQLRALRPDLEYADLRGNVDTRLKKLDAGVYDAVVLAEAGLVRLGLAGRIAEVFPPGQVAPAAGQGALALEYREDDTRTAGLLAFLADSKTTLEVRAERRFLGTLGGGCQVPIGVRAELLPGGDLHVQGMIADLDGERLLRETITGPPCSEPGRALAERMLDSGGRELLQEITGA